MTHPPDQPLPRASRAGLRGPLLAAGAAALVVLTVSLLTRGEPLPVGTFYDDAIYFDLARSLASGHGYHVMYLPGAPPGVKYPPLFPLWLVLWGWPARWMGGAVDPVSWLRAGQSVLVAAAAFLWTLWGARRAALPAWAAAAATVLALLSLPARAAAGVLFSEPLAWLLLGAALIAGPRRSAPEDGGSASGARRRALAEAALVGLLPLVRTLFIPFALALAAQRVLERDRRPAHRALLAAVALGPSLLWAFWVARHASQVEPAWAGSYGSYGGQLAQSWRGVADLLHLVGEHLRAVLLVAAGLFTIPGALLVDALALAGVWHLARSERGSPGLRSQTGGTDWLWWGMAGYFAIVLVWPFHPDRFVWGLLPLLALLAASGAARLLHDLAPRPAFRVAASLLLLVPLGAFALATARAYRQQGWLAPQRRVAAAYRPLVRWAGGLPRGTVVLTEREGLFAIATGLPSAPALPMDAGDDRGRGSPLPGRLQASLCAAGTGWIAATSVNGDLAAAVRVLLADSASPVRFGAPVHLSDVAIAASFTCAARAPSDSTPPAPPRRSRNLPDVP